MRRKTVILALPLLLSATACEKSDGIEKRKSTISLPSESGNNGGEQANPTSGNSQTGGGNTEVPTETGSAALLNGNWHAGGCMASADPAFKAITYDVVISGSNFQKQLKYFSDAACATVSVSTESSGTVNLKGPSSAVLGAYEIDLNVTTFKVDVADEAGVTHLKTNKMCGKEDWKAGDSINCIQGGTVNEYDIVTLKENKLFFGLRDASHDARTAEKRPAALEQMGLSKK